MKKLEPVMKYDSLSPAMKLILLCSVPKAASARRAQIQAIAKTITSWEEVLELVKKNRVSSLVYHNLRNNSDFVGNDTFLCSLESQHHQNQIISLTLLGELVRLTKMLEAQSVSFLPIKGPALAVMVYGNVAYRVSKDLDILIKPEDFNKVVDILHNANYKAYDEFEKLTTRQFAAAFRAQNHFTFRHANGSVIELHWQLISYNNVFSCSDLWDHHSQILINGTSINVPEINHYFLYLIFHGSKHGWKRLRWLCDINEIVKSNDLDWNYILNYGKQHNLIVLIEQAMILLNTLFETTIPDEINRNRPYSIKAANYSITFLDCSDGDIELSQNSLNKSFRQYQLMLSRIQKARIHYYTSRFQPQVEHYQMVEFRGPLYFCYYFVRPFLKLKKIIKHIMPKLSIATTNDIGDHRSNKS